MVESRLCAARPDHPGGRSRATPPRGRRGKIPLEERNRESPLLHIGGVSRSDGVVASFDIEHDDFVIFQFRYDNFDGAAAHPRRQRRFGARQTHRPDLLPGCERQPHRDVGDGYEIAPDLPAVTGDAIALRSAVQNLVANAVKYGGRDRWVGIRAQQVRDGRRSEVRITVSDHGPGIPVADLPHVFERFYRGANVRRRRSGTGMGLAIAKGMLAVERGRISAENCTDGGARFTMIVPAEVM